MSSELDARQRIKNWLDGHLVAANMKNDAGTANASFLVAFGYPNYSLLRVFNDKNIDLIFSVGTPDTVALPLGVGYMENVPISIWCIDKTGITGTKLRWTAEKELRRISETYPLSSLRTLERLSDNEQNLGSTILYSVTYVMRYKRYAT